MNSVRTTKKAIEKNRLYTESFISENLNRRVSDLDPSKLLSEQFDLNSRLKLNYMNKEIPKLESHSPRIIQKVRKKRLRKEPQKIRFSYIISLFPTLLDNEVK